MSAHGADRSPSAFGRLWTFVGVFAVVAAAAVAALTAAQDAQAATCSSAAVTVTPMHSPDGTMRPFYSDTFAAGNTNHSGYVGYELTGASLGSDVWIKLSGFSGGALGLAANQSASVPVRASSQAGHPLVYAYLTATALTASAQTFTVEVWNGKPGQTGSTQVCATTDGFNAVEKVISASANKITSVNVSNSSPAIGGSFDITADGDTGTMGAGLATDEDAALNGVFSMAPAMVDSWPADAFTLTGTQVAFSSGTTYNDKLRVYPTLPPHTNSLTYTATYHFTVRNTTSAPTAVYPVQNIASGTQVKFTGTYPGTISQIPSPAITASLVKTATSVTGPPYHVTYRVVVSNTSTSPVTLDFLRDSPTPTGASNWTFDTGTAKLGGTTIADPALDTGTLVFRGPFAVPGSGSLTFTYTLSLLTTVTNSVVGTVGGVDLGATSGTGNAVSVDPSAPIVTTASLPNATAGTAYSQTLAASNGTSPYSWSVSSGSLPAGLTLNSSTGVLSGTPSASGSSTFTVTATDATPKTGSKSITLTVDAASGGGGSPPADTTAPAGSVALNSGAGVTTSRTLSVGLTATDAVGVVAYRVAEGTDCSAASWTSVTSTTSLSTTTSLTVSSGDGVKTVCAQFKDAVGNSSSTSTSTITLDTSAPSVSLTSAAAATVSGAFTVTATFSESVSTFDASDLTVVNGSASAFSGSGTTYSFTVTPAADGTVTVDIAAGSAPDAAGNANTAATRLSRTADITRPTVTLSSTAGSIVSAPFTVTATFSESVTGFDSSDVTVGNGTASAFTGSGSSYSFIVTPTADGAVTVDVAANHAADLVANGNTAATQLTRTYDASAPSVTLTSTSAATLNGAFAVTVTFSESVTGFDLADLGIGNGAASAFSGSGAAYSFTVTPSTDGAVTVDVAANRAADSAGNANTAAVQLTRTYDATAPSVTLATTAVSPLNHAFTVTAAFSEAVTGFDATDVSAGNGTVSAFTGSGASYSFTVTPAGDGSITVDVAAGSAADSAGNGNTAAARLSRTADMTRPAPALTSAPGTENGPFTVTVTFSESVTGFDASDVSVGNGSISGLSGSGTDYSFTVTPTADGPVIVDVAAGAAADAAGNSSTAAPQLSRSADLTPPTATLTTDAASSVNGAFTVTLTFTEDVTGLTLADLVVGNGTASSLSGSGSTYTFTVTPAAEGPVTVGLSLGGAHDGAGNADLTPTELQVVSDSTPPTVADTSGPSASTTDSVAVFSFAADEATTFTCSLDGAPFSTCTSPAVLGGITDGDHTFIVRATDAAGNTADTTRHWVVAKPVVTFTVRPDDPSDDTLTLAWSTTGSSPTFTCELDGGGQAACASPLTLNGLIDGPHVLTVEAHSGTTLTGSATIRWTSRKRIPKPDVLIIPKISPTDMLGRPQPFKQSTDAPHSLGPFTRKLQVKLHIPTPTGDDVQVDHVTISNYADFRTEQRFSLATDELYDWELLAGPSGDRPVYIRFEDTPDAPVGAATIVLDQELPTLRPWPMTERVALGNVTAIRTAAAYGTLYCGAAPRRWLQLPGADGLSGLNAVQIASNPAHPCGWRPYLPTISYRLPGHLLYVRIEDRVGNVSDWYRIKTK